MRLLTSSNSRPASRLRYAGLAAALVASGLLTLAPANAQQKQERFTSPPPQPYRSSLPQAARPAPQPAPASEQKTTQPPAQAVAAPPMTVPAVTAPAAAAPAPAAPPSQPQPTFKRASSEQSAAACMNEARTTPAEQAIGGCDAVIQETAKNLATAYFFRGIAHRSKNDINRAIADFSQAITLDATDAEYFINRAATYEVKNDNERAIADYDRAIKLNPKSVNAFNYRGAVFQRKGDYARAAADYGEVTKLQPANAEAWNARCWVRAVGGRETQQALADCNEALKIRANSADTFDTRGFVYLKLGLVDAALKDYEAALRIDPKLAGSLYGRGLARQKKGDRTGGAADIAAAKSIRANIAEEFARYGVR